MRTSKNNMPGNRNGNPMPANKASQGALKRLSHLLAALIGCMIIALGFTNCRSSEVETGPSLDASAITIPATTISAFNPRLDRKQGLLLRDHTPYSGWTEERYENGTLKNRIPYWEGKKQGIAKEWHASGQLKSERPYHLGRKHGLHKGWYTNGLPHFVYRFEEGKGEGNHLEWFEDGQVYRNFNYVQGLEVGPQKMYYADGRLRANYVALKGRKYGLTGTNNCDPVTQNL